MQQINEDTGTARAIQRKPNPLANTNTSKYPFELSRGAVGIYLFHIDFEYVMWAYNNMHVEVRE